MPSSWAACTGSATQQSGGTTTSVGTFSIGSLSVAGVPVDLSQLSSAGNPQTVLNVINTALTPVGLNVQWPTQTTLSDGTVQISPLVVGIDNNALGQQVIGANENTVQPVREALVNALLSANCNFATELTVGDIGMGVLSGGGNLNLQLRRRQRRDGRPGRLVALRDRWRWHGATVVHVAPGAAAPATAAAPSARARFP